MILTCNSCDVWQRLDDDMDGWLPQAGGSSFRKHLSSVCDHFPQYTNKSKNHKSEPSEAEWIYLNSYFHNGTFLSVECFNEAKVVANHEGRM